MSRSDDERASDIVEAAEELADIVTLGVQRFRSEPVLRRAAERLLEIIGEAASTLTAEVRSELPEVPWDDIKRLRILLAHHYHRVDADQVWVMAEVDVPSLVARLVQR